MGKTALFVTCRSDSRVTILQGYKDRAPKVSIHCHVWLRSRQPQGGPKRIWSLREHLGSCTGLSHVHTSCVWGHSHTGQLVVFFFKSRRLLARLITGTKFTITFTCCWQRADSSPATFRRVQTLLTSASLAEVVPPGPSWASVMETEHLRMISGYLEPGIGTRQYCQQMGTFASFVKMNFPNQLARANALRTKTLGWLPTKLLPW